MKRFYPRPSVIAAITVSVLLVTLVSMTLSWSVRDRADLFARFSQDRLAVLDDVAQQISEDMHDIADDLRFVGQLMLASPDRDDRMHVLEGLLGTVKMYHTAALYDGSGTSILVVTDPLRGSAVASQQLAAMEQTARDAIAQAAGVQTSLALPNEEDGWFRVFAVPLRNREGNEIVGAIALMIDTRPLFTSLRYVASEPGNALLMLGPSGQPTPSSTASVASAIASENIGVAVTDVLARVQRGERGTQKLTRSEATALGLPADDVLAAYVPIRSPSNQHWSVVSLTSLAQIAAHEELLTWRFASVAVALVILSIAFITYFVSSSRRNQWLHERLRHADEVASLNEQLLRFEKLTTVGILAAGIAHEVGTPLGVVRGRAEYLLNKLEPSHGNRRDVEVIINETDYVSRTIRELLDFARPTPAQVMPVELTAVVQRSIDLLRYELERRRIAVNVEPMKNIPSLAANADQLQQVLVNLMLNAMDACQEHGRISIGAALQTESNDVSIEISDNGCGIPADDIHRVFDPFFTTKKRGQGTGLGLSVVMKVVRSHGADIDLKSRVGQGTTARLKWPIDRGSRSISAN